MSWSDSSDESFKNLTELENVLSEFKTGGIDETLEVEVEGSEDAETGEETQESMPEFEEDSEVLTL